MNVWMYEDESNMTLLFTFYWNRSVHLTIAHTNTNTSTVNVSCDIVSEMP